MKVVVSITAGKRALAQLKRLPTADTRPCFPGQFGINGVPVFGSSVLEDDQVLIEYLTKLGQLPIVELVRLKMESS